MPIPNLLNTIHYSDINQSKLAELETFFDLFKSKNKGQSVKILAEDIAEFSEKYATKSFTIAQLKNFILIKHGFLYKADEERIPKNEEQKKIIANINKLLLDRITQRIKDLAPIITMVSEQDGNGFKKTYFFDPDKISSHCLGSYFKKGEQIQTDSENELTTESNNNTNVHNNNNTEDNVERERAPKRKRAQEINLPNFYNKAELTDQENQKIVDDLNGFAKEDLIAIIMDQRRFIATNMGTTLKKVAATVSQQKPQTAPAIDLTQNVTETPFGMFPKEPEPVRNAGEVIQTNEVNKAKDTAAKPLAAMNINSLLN